MIYYIERSIRLPQELSDQIIGHLQNDSTSLKECSLVCRSWLASSRVHLFRTLLFNATNAAVLASIINQPPGSTIAPYVKRIDFQEAHQFFMKISPHSFLHHFAETLTHVHISNTFLDSFISLVDILCSFPYLQSVSLEHVAWNGSYSTEEAKKPRKWISNSVTHLRFKHTPLAQIMVWLQSHSVRPTFPRITHVEVDQIEEKEVPHVGRYLLIIGTSAKYASLAFGLSEYGYTHMCPYEPRQPSDMKSEAHLLKASAMNLYTMAFGIPVCSYMSAFMVLETFRMEGFLDSSLPEQTTALFWTPRILGSIQSTIVTRVILQLKIDRAGDLDKYNVNWDFIDQVLSTETYSNLRTLDFEVVGRADLDGIGSLISFRLPILARRDMLGFFKS